MRTALAVTVGVLAALCVLPARAQSVPAPTIPDKPTVQNDQPAPVQNPDPAMGGSPSDTSSKTCQTTVPMLQAIPCEIYPANIQAFCQKYKPLQTDMEHCNKAEQYAQSVPPNGQHKQECMKLTFNKGTSAWSFVLACAPTQSSQGATGSGADALNKVGISPVQGGVGDLPSGLAGAAADPGSGTATAGGSGGSGASDPGSGTSATAGVTGGSDAASANSKVSSSGCGSPPPVSTKGSAGASTPQTKGYDCQCLQHLQGMGAKFKDLGQYHFTGPNGLCTVNLAVMYSNRDVNYTERMDCNLALLWENYGKKLKAMGVSKVGNQGSLACRNMNNGRTASNAKSVHSYGFASDQEGFTVNGKLWQGANYWRDPATKSMMEQITRTSCEAFNGTLAFRYYAGRNGYHHIHSQYSQHTCDPTQ